MAGVPGAWVVLQEDDGDVAIPESDRTTIKGNLVNLMSAVPPLIQRQVRCDDVSSGGIGRAAMGGLVADESA